MGSYGWYKSKEMALKLVQNLEGAGDMVKVSLQVFSGPRTWSNYLKCTDELPAGETIDMKSQCGIDWISHYQSDMGAMETAVNGLTWPASTTLTSVALGQAEAELIYGRDDANAVVIVITDGKPMNQQSTIDAARQLQEKARVIWVPVGGGAPKSMIQQVASQPHTDHVVEISEFYYMSRPEFLNKVITDACPVVG